MMQPDDGGASGDLCPNAEEAYVEPSKLRDYLLDPEHETGRHKARVFASALDLRRADWPELAELLVDGLRSTPVTKSRGALGGRLYEVVMPIATARAGPADVTTVWQLDASGRPRLVTAYIRG